MPSFIWDRLLEEAYSNPYEYEAQSQFIREATAFLEKINQHFSASSIRHPRDDTSLEKAIWMLHVDAKDSLRDCLALLKEKRHRIAGRLFRDVVETLDLAAYFHSSSSESMTSLSKWYNDEVVPHREYRDYIGKTNGDSEKVAAAKEYGNLSKLTHRSYRSLALSYTLGKGDTLVYEGLASSGILIPPHTISHHLALLAHLILRFADELTMRGTLSQDVVQPAWESALEAESVPRRFISHPYSRDTLEMLTKKERRLEVRSFRTDVLVLQDP